MVWDQGDEGNCQVSHQIQTNLLKPLTPGDGQAHLLANGGCGEIHQIFKVGRGRLILKQANWKFKQILSWEGRFYWTGCEYWTVTKAICKQKEITGLCSLCFLLLVQPCTCWALSDGVEWHARQSVWGGESPSAPVQWVGCRGTPSTRVQWAPRLVTGGGQPRQWWRGSSDKPEERTRTCCWFGSWLPGLGTR